MENIRLPGVTPLGLLEYPAAAPGQIYNVNFTGTLFGQRIITTFYWYIDTQTGPNVDIGVAQNALLDSPDMTQLKLAYATAMPTDWNASHVSIQKISNPRMMRVFRDWTQFGAQTGAVTANQQVSITRRGLEANRHNVGAIRLPAVSNVTLVEDGMITQAYKELLGNIAAMMVNQIATVIGTTQLVWQPTLGAIVNTLPSLIPIIQTSVEPEVRTLSRRTVGRGI